VITFLLALIAGYGTFLLHTALAFGWRGVRPGPARQSPRRRSLAAWLRAAGLDDVDPRELVAVLVVLVAAGSLAGSFVFGPGPGAAVVGIAAGCIPLAAYRSRRVQRRDAAAEAWPRLIDEVRVLTAASGRSVPQALFDVGARAPEELRHAFVVAHREWLLTTDLDRSLHVLRSLLADPTADAVCETLVVAHRLGGNDLERRLRALAEDRRMDLEGRKDARARQAGARFARRFVLIVPAGMAMAGMGIGDGRAAYATPLGQGAVLVAAVMVAACWWWAGRVMAMPRAARVFTT
jgi:tight adherence protein B